MNIPLPQRVPTNAPGDFYVEAGCCLSCGLARDVAPELVCLPDNGECYFTRQPETAEEIDRAIDAIDVSEVGALRYGGRDQAIIAKLHLRGAARQCDHPLGGMLQSADESSSEPVPVQRESWWRRVLRVFRDI